MDISFTPVDHPLCEKMASSVKEVYNKGVVKANPSGCVLPSSYKDSYKKITDFEVREDDVWIVSFPRSGGAWTREMVWLLVNDLNFAKAKMETIQQRAPFIESQFLSINFESYLQWDECLNKQRGPRCVFSHLHKELLPRQLWTKKPKMVYVARNAKDALLSSFFMNKTFLGYTGSLELLSDAFMEDILLFTPYWKHILDFWNMKETNILFNTYEEMKKDLPGVIRRTANFLNKEYSDEQLSRLEEHLSFQSMKDNPSVNFEDLAKSFVKKYNMEHKYMRRGESGAWREELPEDLVAKIDAWSNAHLEGSDYPHYE